MFEADRWARPYSLALQAAEDRQWAGYCDVAAGWIG